tara:strand:- start:982 stop:1428 length:447 start_codon:yes stop_codon:yes gene_type:complete
VNHYGFKSNLSDINASILTDQVVNYSKTSKIKKYIFKKYKKHLGEINQINFPLDNKNKDRDYYLLPIGVDKKYRNKLIEHLLNKKIFVTVNFRSITELSYYKKKYKRTTCPISEKWGKEQISLPFHVKITESEIKTVCLEIKKFFKKN